MEVALEAYTEPELRSVAKVLGTHLWMFIPTNNDTCDSRCLQTKPDPCDLVVSCFRKQASLNIAHSILIQHLAAAGHRPYGITQHPAWQTGFCHAEQSIQGRLVLAALHNTCSIRSVSPNHFSISERKSAFLQTVSTHNAEGFQRVLCILGLECVFEDRNLQD